MTPGRANLDVLRGRLGSHDGLVVAYSGGADSAFLAVVAHQALRDRMVAVTAVSPSLAAAERADAAAFAAERRFRHVEVETDELDSAAYRANAGDRCAHCKDALMDALLPVAEGAPIALGVNTTGRLRRLPVETQGAVLRVVQEAVANVVRHADATRIDITLSYRARSVRVTVVDDGRGFSVEPDFRAYAGHWGLLGMQERAEQVGATLRVRSTADKGATVTLEVPLTPVGAERRLVVSGDAA